MNRAHAILRGASSPAPAQTHLIFFCDPILIPVSNGIVLIPDKSWYLQILILFIQLVKRYHQTHHFPIILGRAWNILHIIPRKGKRTFSWFFKITVAVCLQPYFHFGANASCPVFLLIDKICAFHGAASILYRYIDVRLWVSRLNIRAEIQRNAAYRRPLLFRRCRNSKKTG